jgi:GR25 family glycosyltransferase involved in LPS biosynthesis
MSKDQSITKMPAFASLVKSIHQTKKIDAAIKHDAAELMWHNAVSPAPNNASNNLHIDKVYCIALNADQARTDELTKRFESFGLNSPFEVWGAIDGKNPQVDFKYNIFHGWKIRTDNSFWNREITSGEVGCALSHLTIWRDAFAKGYQNILVLEEDFKVLRPFEEKEFLTTNEWTMIYLGRNKIYEDKKEISEFLVEPDYSYTSHAYILNREGIKRLIDQNFQNNICAVDEFLPATYTKHPRADMEFIWRDTLAMALKNDMIGQTSNSYTSTTENTEAANIPTNLETQKKWKNERLYPDLFDTSNWEEWKRRWLHESALTKEWSLIVDEPIESVFSFPMFRREFCEKLIQEAEHAGKWTRERHQFYPTHDMLLTEFGFQDIYHRLLVEYAYPMAKDCWFLEGHRWDDLDSENFIIKYDHTIQGHLSLHHDNAVISCVLALNDDYVGGGTYFSKQKKLHKGAVGHISVHPGIITHRHGGRPVEDGQRFIVVSFCNFRR